MRDQILEYDPSYLIYGGGTSFVINVIIFRFVSPFLSRRITETYRDLSNHEQLEWNDRLISNVNSVISVLLSGYCLLYEDGSRADVWYNSGVARTACAVIVGYMFADILCMIFWCKMKRGEFLGYVFHHAATVYAYYFISAYGVLCYFGMFRLIAEVSTVPVNQRWFFDITGYPRARIIVVLNGFCMLITFFIFRIFAMPLYWYQIWMVTYTEAVRKLGHIQLIMYIPCFVLDVLNIMWFYKMFKGFIKALKGILNVSGPDSKEKLKSV